MSGAITAAVVGGVAGVATAAFSAYQQKRAGDRQADAMRQQAANQRKLALEQDQAENRANQRQVNPESLLNDQTTEGLGSTTLTGAGGSPINPNALGGGSKLLGG